MGWLLYERDIRTGSVFLDWADVATAMESEIILNGRTRAKEIEGRVLAKAKEADGGMAVREE